jgi:hypothetical protein
MGRRIKGVDEIWVDRQESMIYMDFDGNPATVDKITAFVKAIGYEAAYQGVEPTPETEAAAQ